MSTRKITLYEAFGPQPTKEGKAAVYRAIEYAAKEQNKVLRTAMIMKESVNK